VPHAISPAEKNDSFFRGLCVRLTVFTPINPPIKHFSSEKRVPRVAPDVSKWQQTEASCLSLAVYVCAKF
jgi:hypothetical protein